uniref:Ubiquitin carboxyl-terminal hydrolase n=1 Tax=Denticeps clupeoides TaxID=299321 RepID=A0AAY4E4R0_9TELE
VIYIFGEFSQDEFNQFFVTPRCYVELPPFNEKVSCVSHSSGSYCTPAVPYLTDSVRRQVCGEDYQHIEFGVDEVMDPEPVGAKDPTYKVSSTLNPQAPEFILGCQTSQMVQQVPQDPDVPDGGDFNLLDCPDSELPGALSSCSELDGMSGGLGQRERKKKKKRPPGYYNYLEGSAMDNSGVEGLDVGPGLVNGHSLNVSSLHANDSSPDGVSAAQLSASTLTPNTTTTITSTSQAVAATANQRTCSSPDETSLDLMSGGGSLDSNNIASLSSSSSSSSSSQSGRVVEGSRTGGQRADLLALDRSEQLDTSSHSSCPNSTPTPPATAASPPAAPPTAIIEQELSRVANGVAEVASAAGSADDLEDSDIGEGQPHAAAPLQVAHSEARPGVDQTLAPAPSSGASPHQPKSWASLFHNSKPLPGGPQAYVEVKNAPVVVAVCPTASEVPDKAGEARDGPVPVTEDPMALKLAELIENVKLIHKPLSLQPRGLINKGNWCYINATLQALIACPPMYHLLKSIPLFSETQRSCTSTPMMDNFVRLVNEFSNMPVPSKAKQQATGDKVVKDIRPGVPFEPTYIYKLLTLIKSSLSEKGRQEDAEEYLGFTLNGLHEEMLALKKLISPQEEKVSTPNGPESHPGLVENSVEKEDEEGGSEDEWEQVGPRNKTSITRQADFIRTPITDIFGGHIRSVVYQQSSKESATLQPFFSLQLDIQSEKIRTVQEALETLVARESVQGYTTKSKQEIEISRRVTLEELPPVLVLHLKRFVFEKTGGCQKLVKNIDYPVDLEISKDLLSPGVRSKIFKGQRTYRLFAVVYHHGNSATGGHYTTDVFHIGLNGWLRIDDQAVKVINQYQVVKQTAERTAYLLYYRRVDLL